MKENDFDIADKFYHTEIKLVLREEIKMKVATGQKRYENSTYFHCLQMTDYSISKAKNRLYIVTKGFLNLYNSLKKEFQQTIRNIGKEVKVISKTNDQEVKEFFINKLGVKEQNYKIEPSCNIKPVIIADNDIRIAIGNLDLNSLGINDVKADVLLDSKKEADEGAKIFLKSYDS